ncbi:MAG: glycosyltransferase family 4 protein [Pseudomonadota bacterium]
MNPEDPAPVRVLMVTREGLEDRRFGLGRSLATLIPALQDQGVAVTYLCRDQAIGLPVWTKGLARWWAREASSASVGRAMTAAFAERLAMGYQAAGVLVQQGHTHVHCHDPWIALGFWLTVAGTRYSGVPWGFTQHGFGAYVQSLHEEIGPLTVPQWRRLRHLENRVAEHARWVMTPTRLAMNQLVRDLGRPAPASHWHVVPHPRPIAPPRMDASTARSSPGLRCLVVGREAALKRQDLVIRACARLAPSIAWHLTLLGVSPVSSLTSLARQLGVAERVDCRIVESVWEDLFSADCYISTSTTESFGLANLEALQAGLPMICTAVGGVPEVVGPASLWIPPDDTDALVMALTAYAQDEGLRTAMAALARQRGASWPEASHIASKYVAIYRAAMAR